MYVVDCCFFANLLESTSFISLDIENSNILCITCNYTPTYRVVVNKP